jgi:hypothetical protein
MTERLMLLKDIHVPIDLDEGSEPQCNEQNVWQLPVHLGNDGKKCTGSENLIYNTDLTLDTPFEQQTICDICKKTFSTS